jgi:hypothetical protein
MEPYGDQPATGPRVEPAVHELELGRAGWELEEAEGGAEGGEARGRVAASTKCSAANARRGVGGRSWPGESMCYSHVAYQRAPWQTHLASDPSSTIFRAPYEANWNFLKLLREAEFLNKLG